METNIQWGIKSYLAVFSAQVKISWFLAKNCKNKGKMSSIDVKYMFLSKDLWREKKWKFEILKSRNVNLTSLFKGRAGVILGIEHVLEHLNYRRKKRYDFHLAGFPQPEKEPKSSVDHTWVQVDFSSRLESTTKKRNVGIFITDHFHGFILPFRKVASTNLQLHGFSTNLNESNYSRGSRPQLTSHHKFI